MAIFEEVRLSFDGKEYRIPPDDLLKAIAKVEDIITLAELFVAKLPLSRLSQAYGALLRHAGAKVSDEEVYSGMFTGGGAEMPRRARDSVTTLIALMVPPEHMRKKLEEDNSGKAGDEAQRAASSPVLTSS